MSDNTFIVELFIKTLDVKHKLTFDKEKQEYFRVLFDTYLNGQGNADELRDYIAAGIEDPKTIDIIAKQVVQWQGKASEMKAAEEAKRKNQQAENKKLNEYVDKKTKKAKEDADNEKEKKGDDKDKRPEDHGRKKHKGQRSKPEGEEKGQKGQKGEKGAQGQAEGHGLKYELTQQGREKCKFYPFCKNEEKCEFFHPSDKCTFFPHCRYGQNCLYAHEACKFKEKCMKPNCPFAHPYKKTNPLEDMMRSFMSQHNPLGARNSKKKFKPRDQGGHEAHDDGKKE